MKLLLLNLFCLSFTWTANQYPSEWWQPIAKTEEPKKSWEKAPDTAKPGEVVVSKRRGLRFFSNFWPTEFSLDGKSYPSVEGFWQMMKFPDAKLGKDKRKTIPQSRWGFTRQEVSEMSMYEAKGAGSAASKLMKELNVNWVSYLGKQMTYRTKEKGEHYKLIYRALLAKIKQNPKLAALLKKTKGLKLVPDHRQGPETPPAWRYCDILMDIRSKL